MEEDNQPGRKKGQRKLLIQAIDATQAQLLEKIRTRVVKLIDHCVGVPENKLSRDSKAAFKLLAEVIEKSSDDIVRFHEDNWERAFQHSDAAYEDENDRPEDDGW